LKGLSLVWGLIHCKDEFIAIYPGAKLPLQVEFTSTKVGVVCTRGKQIRVYINACIHSNIMISIKLCCILFFGGTLVYCFGLK